MQLKTGKLLYFLLALQLAGCTVRPEIPVHEINVEIEISTKELICRVRSISKSQHLDFYYGTSSQPFGTMVTFDLKSKDFEFVLYNPESKSKYFLSAYANEKHAEAAKVALEDFHSALLRQDSRCRS